MPVIRNLYLSDRVFYVLAANIFLFILSYVFEIVFLPALGVLIIFSGVLLADIFLLFRSNAVTAQRKVSTVLSLNDENEVQISISNHRRSRVWLRLVDEMPYQFKKRDFSVNVILDAGEQRAIRYFLRPGQRGEYEFGDIHVFVKTALGLAMKRETSPAKKAVAVYPSIIQMYRQELIALHHPSFIQGGNKNRKLGQSYEFDQVKLYVPGDDTRNINWKASSSLGEIMVNLYEDERSQQVYSIIDKSRVMKMPFNGLTLVDYAINSTLALSNIILKKHDKAGLIIFSKGIGANVKADKGPRHLRKLLHALYKEKYDYSEANYEALYSTIRSSIPNRSLLFLYTSFDSIYALERNLPVLKLLNKNHLLVIVFFENEELESYSRSEATDLLDIYQTTIAKKFILEKNQIYKELQKHGIQSIKTAPEKLSASTINKYLELKTRGLI